MYDEEISLDYNNNYFEGGKDDPSTIHHFYHKSLKLKDNMNTQTARNIANERTEYMKNFVKEFMDEWYGNK